ncbi:MAG: hypothetical protein E6G67_08790 [Actinobacteria bacterium]|nr:MAG: hypothetical protein E6G67_08790 [Actinomycetota bacterium]
MHVRSGEILAGIGDERGGVLVMVALWLPVLVLLASFVIDVGNWFEHKRHLQLQADAGALAAAQDFRIPCSDPPIVAQAQNYSGGQYNAQVGGTSSSQVHMLINSLTYYNQSSPVDSTVNPSPPCSAVMVDVKMTETDLPWFLRLARVPFINAHARVSILQKDTTAGALPVGVPDVNPKVARVTFFNETPPYQILGTQALTPAGSANGLALWDNSGAPLPRRRHLDHLRSAARRELRRHQPPRRREQLSDTRHPVRARLDGRRQRCATERAACA